MSSRVRFFKHQENLKSRQGRGTVNGYTGYKSAVWDGGARSILRAFRRGLNLDGKDYRVNVGT